MPDIIGEKLESYVINQILDRQELHGKGAYGKDVKFIERSSEVLDVLNSNTAWVKMASGVKIEDSVLQKLNINSQYSSGLDLARKNILYSGLSEYQEPTTDKDGNTVYSPLKTKDGFLPFNPQSSYSYGQYGFSPMPGITSVDVKAMNRGSIKKATVKLKAHNKQQFDIIDVLYLRLGYTVLLEWGNSLYITKKGSQLTKKIVRNTLIEETFFNESSNTSYERYLDLIEEKRDFYDGNYDALLGKISNFDWTFNVDGSYDITVTIISMGDIIESLKTNVPLSLQTNNFLNRITNLTNVEDSDNINRNAKANAISSMLFLFKSFNPPLTSSTKVTIKGAGASNETWVGSLLRNSNTVGGIVPTKWSFYFSITINGQTNTDSLLTETFSGDPADILDAVDKKLLNYANSINSITAIFNFGSNIFGPYTNKDINPRTNIYRAIIDKKSISKKIIEIKFEAKGDISSGTGDNPLGSAGLKDGFRLFTDDPETAINYSEPSTIEQTYYLRFGYLLEFMKDNCMPTIASNKLPLIKIPASNTPMFTIDNYSMSLDPRICVVKTKIYKWDLANSKLRANLAELYNGLEDWNDNAMNVYLNFNFILDSISSATDERGDVNMYNFLLNICNGINKALGSINNLEPIINEEENTLRFIDSSYSKIDRGGGYAINLLGYKKEGNFYASNFIRKIDLRTAITPEYASMVTIGTTAGGYVKGTEGTTFAKWNTGIIDRFKETINSGAQTPSENIQEIESKYREEVLSKLQEGYGLSSFNPSNNLLSNPLNQPFYTRFKENVITKNLSLGSEYFKMSLSRNNQSSMGFVPFKLGITMDGLSGIKIYSKINVDTSFLPSNYGDTLSFIVTGVNHTLQNNDWVTELATMAVPGTQEKATILYTGDYSTTTEVPTNPGGNNSQTSYSCTDVEAQFGTKIESPNFDFSWTIPTGYGNVVERSNNIQTLIDYFKSQGITNPFAIMALIGTSGKESQWIPTNEASRFGYTVDNAVSIWTWLPRSTAEQLLKTGYQGKPPGQETLLNYVYGPNTSSPPGGRTPNGYPAGTFLGNKVWGDGYRYRGRGFHQLTFKGTYKWISDTPEIQTATRGQGILNNPDIINSNPKIAAAVYFVFMFDPSNGAFGSKSKANGFTSPCEALQQITAAVAGGASTGAFNAAVKVLQDINFKIIWK